METLNHLFCLCLCVCVAAGGTDTDPKPKTSASSRPGRSRGKSEPETDFGDESDLLGSLGLGTSPRGKYCQKLPCAIEVRGLDRSNVEDIQRGIVK